jgi:predicted nucleic acid-binding Zn ribbon protein
MRRKNPKATPQPIGDILFAALKKRGMAVPLADHAILKLWPKAVGDQIAKQTRPDRLHAGTLFVRTTSSIWVQQLHFMKEDIRHKLNQMAGKTVVRDIHFTIGFQSNRTQNETAAEAMNNISLKDRDRKMIEESTAGLADRELAQIIRRVMEKEISRRRRREEKPDR